MYLKSTYASIIRFDAVRATEISLQTLQDLRDVYAGTISIGTSRMLSCHRELLSNIAVSPRQVCSYHQLRYFKMLILILKVIFTLILFASKTVVQLHAGQLLTPY